MCRSEAGNCGSSNRACFATRGRCQARQHCGLCLYLRHDRRAEGRHDHPPRSYGGHGAHLFAGVSRARDWRASHDNPPSARSSCRAFHEHVPDADRGCRFPISAKSRRTCARRSPRSSPPSFMPFRECGRRSPRRSWSTSTAAHGRSAAPTALPCASAAGMRRLGGKSGGLRPCSLPAMRWRVPWSSSRC